MAMGSPPRMESQEKRKGLLVKTIIHVNQHAIKRNVRTGSREPVLTVKTYKSNTYAHEVVIDGPSRIVYSPDKPLSCGARVWIETESKVHIRNDEHNRHRQGDQTNQRLEVGCST